MKWSFTGEVLKQNFNIFLLSPPLPLLFECGLATVKVMLGKKQVVSILQITTEYLRSPVYVSAGHCYFQDTVHAHRLTNEPFSMKYMGWVCG